MSKKPKNPVNDKKGSYRVVRGGYWGHYPSTLRSAQRYGFGPGNRPTNGDGFRIVRNIPKKEKRDE